MAHALLCLRTKWLMQGRAVIFLQENSDYYVFWGAKNVQL
jgi:hypothetical protein